METLVIEKTPSPSKKIKNPKRSALYPLHVHHNYPQSAMKQGMILMHGVHGGVISNSSRQPSFSLSSSLPPHNHLHPPLLPLPGTVSKPTFLSLPPPSPSPTPTAHSLSKRKQQPRQQRKAKKTPIADQAAKSDDVVQEQPPSSSKKQLTQPDQGNDPKEETRVDIIEDKSSGSSSSVFMSLCPPPPSSLPMPKFSLIRQPQPPPLSQPKFSCTAEVDDGATDNLCRLLRLR